MTNLLTLTPYMSHSGGSFGYRCITVTVVHAGCIFVWSVLQFSVERSGTIDLSRRPKIFVRASISKSWAKILPRGHISGHLEILGDFLGNIFTRKGKQKLVGEILGKIKIFVQHLFVPVRTALSTAQNHRYFQIAHSIPLVGVEKKRRILMGPW